MRICCLKKGVSLVTVLVFMTIATIAATATYKWLSSVGFTSADRMAINEAKESSHAGLEAIRSWMTYHANDVGAIVRQYYDGGKKPVALDPLLPGSGYGRQRFSVWLTGVETSGASHKFTIVSTGTSRTDTKYSETSVLNVRGLYKVKVPVMADHKALEYGYSYFGGTTQGGGNSYATSMLVNGDWSGNPLSVDSDFVVTGNVTLSGNDIKAGLNTCIGGNLNAENKGFSGRNIYVHGNTNLFSGRIGGTAYFNGNLGRSHADSMVASGDFTVNGNFETFGQSQYNFIKGNFCLSGELDVSRIQKKFEASANVKFKKSNPIVGVGTFGYSAGALVLGGEGYSRYISNADLCDHSVPNIYCLGSDPSQAFISYAHNAGSVTADMNCDEGIKDFCLSNKMLGAEKTSCDTCCGANFKIPDMLKSSYESFKNFNGPCSDTTLSDNEESVAVLNNCYKKAKNNSQLFHGFLVVKINADDGRTIFSNPTDSLNGNFIFYADEPLDGVELKFPLTSAKTNAFVYLHDGAYKVSTNEDIGLRNYFFFSEGNIDWLEHGVDSLHKEDRKWMGSFYMSADNCSKIEKINSSGIQLLFNENLAQTLLDSSIICNISESGDCGKIETYGTDSTNTDGEYNVVGYDIYYVATAPILSISLESQRRNKVFVEPVDYTTVAPSIVVLPRIVYLSDAPEGRLQDYYNVINLNGATEQRNVARTSCTPALDPTGVLATPPDKLVPDVYKCEYEAENAAYGKNHFWVVVDGNVADKSTVSFGTEYVRMFAGNDLWTNVDLSVGTQQPSTVSVTVSMTDVPEGWSVDSSAVTSLGDGRFKVTIAPGVTKTVFKVKTPVEAAKSLITFRIEELSSNARVGTHSFETLQLMGEGTVIRDTISDAFCEENGNKLIKDVTCTDIDTIPDCTGALLNGVAENWIHPNIYECNEMTKNKEWKCRFTSTRIKLEEGVASPYCEIYNYGDSIVNPVDGGIYYLHASYKAKMLTVNLKVEGAVASDVDVRISNNVIDSGNVESISPEKCYGGNTCTYKVPAGYNMYFVANQKGGEIFDKWVLTGKNVESRKTITEEYLSIFALSDTLVTAVFNDDDTNHCFYSDFVNTRIWCSRDKDSTDDCIDMCDGAAEGGNFKQGACATKGSGNDDVGTRSTSYWIVTRSNAGQAFCKPQKDGDNFLYYYAKSGNGCAEGDEEKGKNNNSGNSSVAYLLNRVEAGTHGKLTARFKTCKDEGNQKNWNSGFVLRSSANSGDIGSSAGYAIVHVLGEENGNNMDMKTRVCFGDGSGIKNGNDSFNEGGTTKNCAGTETYFGLSVPKEDFSKQIFNVEIEVPKGKDYAVILLSYKNGDSWVQSKRVSVPVPVDSSRNAKEYYVGASLADNCFKVGNIGWESYDFEGGCSNVPKVSCSFGANYLGGLLPKEEEVSPWVGTSTWFRDSSHLENPFAIRKECKLSYHYNGCDVPSGYVKRSNDVVCSSDDDIRAANNLLTGKAAKTMDDENYKFTREGLHGYETTDNVFSGRVRDASVVMDCGILGVFTESCGEFNVGTITSCSQNASFDISCSSSRNCVATSLNGFANLRSSDIIGELSYMELDSTGLPYGVEMEFVDSMGLTSQVISIDREGEFRQGVDLYADMYGFNPERIAAIRFTSRGYFTLTNLRSECPYAFGIGSCSARIVNGHVEVRSTMTNPVMATCDLSINNSSYRSGTECPSDGVYEISPADLAAYTSADGQYAFSVVMRGKTETGITDYCLTNAISMNPVSSSSLAYSSSSSKPAYSSSSKPESSSSSKQPEPYLTCSISPNDGGSKGTLYTYTVTTNIADVEFDCVPNKSNKISGYSKNTAEKTVTFKAGTNGSGSAKCNASSKSTGKSCIGVSLSW